MIFTRKTYRIAVYRAGNEQDIQWRRFHRNKRRPRVQDDLNRAIRAKNRIWDRWGRERDCR